MKCLLLRLFSLGVIFVLLSCASRFPSVPYDSEIQRDLDENPIPRPEENDVGEKWDFAYNHVFRQLYRLINVPGWFLPGSEAVNVNDFDEVPNSTWFTNRLTHLPLSNGALKRGPRSDPGPDPTKPWTVIKGKSDGVSPGFVILDSKKDMYFIKFDPPGYNEIGTAAEVISSLILYAIGYNVPSNFVVYIKPKMFQLSPKAKSKDRYGRKIRFEEETFRSILRKVDTLPDGTVRVIASKAIEGRPIGPFCYEGTRSDDPNDRVRHEDRREIRAYNLFSAWLNNSDVRAQNTLDTYVGNPGKGFVKHYLLDFGTAMGADGETVKDKKIGYEYLIDWGAIGEKVVTLGVGDFYWETNQSTDLLSVGMFEAENFDPNRWRSQYANPSFERITDRDGFWATKRIMAFTDEMLGEIVKEGRYSSKRAAALVAKVLGRRRDKFGEVWFNRVTPLDDFEVVKDRIEFTDLAKLYGLVDAKGRRYRYALGWSGEWEEGEVKGPRLAVDISKWMRPGSRFRLQLEIEDEDRFTGDGVEVFGACSKSGCRVVGLAR